MGPQPFCLQDKLADLPYGTHSAPVFCDKPGNIPNLLNGICHSNGQACLNKDRNIREIIPNTAHLVPS